jgi:hypothetical protein
MLLPPDEISLGYAVREAHIMRKFGSLGTLLATLFRELAHGSPDPSARTYILNQGDTGLLASLDRLSAAAASATGEGPSIAAHVDHLRYALSLLNRWATGSPPPWPDMDWTAS